MAEDSDKPVEVKIERVLVFRESGTVGVVLTHPEKTFVIFVGQAEGAAVDRELRGVRADRPMTHDLMEYALKGLDVRLTRAVICAVRNGVYLASLVFSQEQEGHRNEVRLDARASDAMVFALKWSLPLLVSPSVLATVEDFTEQLEMLDSKEGDAEESAEGDDDEDEDEDDDGEEDDDGDEADDQDEDNPKGS